MADTMPPPEYAMIVLIVFIGGFAIQQFLQFVDFFIERFINKRKKDGMIYRVSVDVFKKSLLLFLSSSLGTIVACLGNVRLLSLAFPPPTGQVVAPTYYVESGGYLDLFVTGLVIGSGTEAVNTVMKFLGYIKEAQKVSIVGITLIPSTASIDIGKTVKFKAIVTNGDSSAVEWSVIEGDDGGRIEKDKDKALYTAPGKKGVYHVLAMSTEDSTKTFMATVTVNTPSN